MRIVVDTNIIFSAILNTESNISRVLFQSQRKLSFVAPEFLKHEIQNHRGRLKKFLKLDESELDELIAIVSANISFMNEKVIPAKHWRYASKILQTSDLMDSPFVALGSYLRSPIWTGDKRLIKALQTKRKSKVLTTKQMLEIIK